MSNSPTTPDNGNMTISFTLPTTDYKRFAETCNGHGERTVVLRRLVKAYLAGDIVLSLSGVSQAPTTVTPVP
jgi:hypothetical protein